MDAILATKYPFLSISKKLIKKKEISETDVEKAINRIENRLNKKERKPYKDASEEIENYALSRLLLSVFNNFFLTKAFAEGEAKQAAYFLYSEEENYFIEVCRDFFPSITLEKGFYSINLFEYLRYGTDLVNSRLVDSRILFHKDELILLLRKAISDRIINLSKADLQNIPEVIKKKASELSEIVPKNSVNPVFKGKYLALPCIQTLLKGVPEGKRYYGSLSLAIACYNDGLEKTEAIKVMQEFVSNCPKGIKPFTLAEGLNTLEWVYRKKGIRFSCKTMKEYGLDNELCKECSKAKGFEK